MPSEIARLVSEATEAYRSGGYDAIVRLLHPDGHAFIQDDLPNGGRWEGREGFAAMLREWDEAWEEFGYEILDLEEHGDRAVTRVRQHGVARGSGMEIDMELYYVWGARDVDERSGVAVDGERLRPEPREVHALNKPAGVVSTARDTHGRPTVVELVRSSRRLYPVGRLDADTTGLILLTNDGELAELLTHPRHGVERVYRARVRSGPISEKALRELREGVELEDGRTAPARVRQLEPGVLEIRIREGRKRQVRRMCEAVGHRVEQLERVAFGPLRLGDLKPGKSRRLTPAEVERLRKTGA